MTPKTNPQNCETGHCDDHSGLLVWMKATTALGGLAVSLLSYSVIWQAPNLRMDIAREVARLDKRDDSMMYDIQDVKRDVTDIGRRVSLLEGK